MPEDDFDIYGEDEGFNVKVDEVRPPILMHVAMLTHGFQVNRL